MHTKHYTAPFSLLIIDDDQRFRSSISVYFEDSGIKVFEAENGVTGLEILHQHHPDIILVDLSMPFMDGFQFIDQLRREAPGQSVIVISGTGNLERAVNAIHKGVWDFVTKPIHSMAALEHLIRRCIERVRLKQENEQYRLHLEKLVELRTAELTSTRQQVVERLCCAAAYRDHGTGMHIMRMSRYARLLALKANMSHDEAELLLLAASMHDIGKIGVPDEILRKQDNLTREEWQVMMSHVEMGVLIIGDDSSALMQMARMVVSTHHERWDGSGYPNGLVGEEIPLVGRIVAIVDVFDALTSARPYKQSWGLDKALAYMQEQAGKCFDPNLIPLLIGILPDMLDIQNQYHD
ncbi:MAG: response regulator [Gallionella sp.]|nr:response regulator [Gallionella sp.]MDD4960576.1 response regulator [Gallionella sp.]